MQVQVLSPAPRRCGRHIVRSDFFAKVASHSFCRSSFPNRPRCRWASIRLFILIGVSFFVNATTSLRTAYRSQRLFCKSHFSLILSQLLSESNPLSLGFDSVFYFDWGIFFCQCFPRRRGLRIIRDGVFLFKANAVSHSLRRSYSPPQSRRLCGDPKYRPHIACGMHFLQKLPARAFRCVSFSEKGRAAPSPLACKRARTASAYQPFSGHEDSALTGNIRKYLFIVLRHVGASFVSLAPIFLYKNQSARTPQLLLCAKSHARLASSVVNALTSPR